MSQFLYFQTSPQDNAGPYWTLIANSQVQVWNTLTQLFETYNASNIAHYVITATNWGMGRWYITFPAIIGAGAYSCFVYKGLGAVGDIPTAIHNVLVPTTTTQSLTPVLGSDAATSNIVKVYQYIPSTIQFTAQDTQGNPINLSTSTVQIVVYQDNGVNQIGIFEHDNAGIGGITISGTNSNLINVQLTTGDVANAANYLYTCWNVSTNLPLFVGTFEIAQNRITVP